MLIDANAHSVNNRFGLSETWKQHWGEIFGKAAPDIIE
jgi:hypothetical protein